MKSYISGIMLLLCVYASAQDVQVLNSGDLSPVSNCTVVSNNKKAATNSKGVVSLSEFDDADSLEFAATGFTKYVATKKTIVSEGSTVYLYSSIITLNEFVFSATRSFEKKENVPYQMEVISNKQIVFSNPQTSADMLQNTGGIFVQKSQAGGGSPVLRGFEANRVLIVIDGVRMNNAIYRGGHLQDVITIDNNMLERTEIIFGPSSTLYGSDALGGVIHFFTKKPVFTDSGNIVKGNLYHRYSSVNSEMTSHMDFTSATNKWVNTLSVTHSSFGDLRSGRNRNPYDTMFGKCLNYVETINGVDSMIKNNEPWIQKKSGYTQTDFFDKLSYKQNETTTHSLNIQYSTSSDVPRYDRLQEYKNGILRFAEWNYGPQKRFLGSYNLTSIKENKIYNSISSTVAYQHVVQERVNRRFKNNNRKTQTDEVDILSANIDAIKTINENNTLKYGLESAYNIVGSAAHFTDIRNDSTFKADTRYPDGGSSTMSNAFYAMYTYSKTDQLHFNAGVRFSNYTLQSEFNDTAFYNAINKKIKQSSNAFSGTIGAVYSTLKKWHFAVSLSSGFRAPNVDDLGKVFDTNPGYLVIPNSELKPEYSYNGDVRICKEISNIFSAEVTGFYTYIKDIMVVKKTKLNSQDSLLYNGVMSGLYSMQNANSGYIYGTSGGVFFNFSKNVSFKSTATYTYGRYYDKENDTIVPLDHIPPVIGLTSINFKFKKIESEVYTRYNGWKLLRDYSPSGEDNLSQATPYGMPSWATLNIKLSYAISKYFKVNSGVENILDSHYRYFASGISAPGRNYYLTLRGSF